MSTKLACLCSIALLAAFLAPQSGRAGGVTLITHGYNGNVNGWVSGMAGAIPKYARFPGTNFTTYTITLTTDGSSYFYTWSRTNSSPALTDSGELIVKLDWTQLAGGSAPYNISTYTIAGVASAILLQTNAISELNGHALAEFPLHLIGHSRGGSLVSEISRLLGTNGVWVDHLTTLDPHPLNNDGNSELFQPTDASAKNAYANVLFCDDYWQKLGDNLFTPNGEAVSGAFVRQFTNLDGGYSSSHSDTHLWYHGTLMWTTPASDSEASISSSERQAWWVNYEQRGTNAGFVWSLLGGGNRLSFDQPQGPGFPAIRDGYNQTWDLGAGVSSNRTSLSTNTGAWPSLIKFSRTDTNQITQGQAVGLRFYYQWARPAASNALVSFYLDDDLNPLNNNSRLIGQLNVPGTGTGVNLVTTAFPLYVTNAAPGFHALLAVVSAAGRTRFLYAPESIQIMPNLQPPTMEITRLNASQLRISVNGQPGQTLILQTGTDLLTWQSVATNALTTPSWLITNAPGGAGSPLFYRSKLGN